MSKKFNEAFAEKLHSHAKEFNNNIPSIDKSEKFLEQLICLMFPIRDNQEYTLGQTERQLDSLHLDFQKLLTPIAEKCDQSIFDITESFFEKLPNIYDHLLNDARAFMNFDPAAKSLEGIIVSYPGFYAITVYRLAHELYKLDVPYIPRMFSEFAHSKTGIDIHPGATIGEHFLIDHGTGIVIGETSIIGNNVKIYQGVTLGALYVNADQKEMKRHPTIEDGVIIYAGSTILGGRTFVGANSIIGGNSWVTKSVPSNSLVFNESKSKVRQSNTNSETIDFII